MSLLFRAAGWEYDDSEAVYEEKLFCELGWFEFDVIFLQQRNNS